MADVSITVANVIKGSNAVTATGTAGATIDCGMALYIDTNDSNKLKRAVANDTAAKSVVAGIALSGGRSGQPIVYQTSGSLTIGGTLTVGMVYMLSTTAGGIRPASDVANTNYPTIIGYASTNAILVLNLVSPQVQIGSDIT